MQLNDVNAVVTGVNKGIGKAVVEGLLEGGARVSGWGRTPLNVRNPNFQFFPCQLDDFGSVEKTAHATMAWLGTAPNVVFNNAGMGYFAMLEDYSLEQWHEMVSINMHAPFYILKCLLPEIKKLERGHLFNMSSLAGLDGMAQASGYCAVKHGIRGMSSALTKELRDHNIKVTTIYPGSTQTDFFQNAPGIEAHAYMMQPGDVAGQVIQAIQTPDNFLVDHLQFRPLQPKGPRQKT